MKTSSLAILTMFAAVGLSMEGLASQRAQSAPGVDQDVSERTWSLVTDGSWMATLTVRKSKEMGGMWMITPLEGPALVQGAPVAVMPLRSYVPYPSYASALRLTDGRWAFVGDVHGGGSRILQYAVVEADLPNRLARPEPLRDLPPDIVDVVELERGSGVVRLLDLYRPALIELDRRTYVLASGGRGENIGGGITWVAEADIHDRALKGWIVGEGVDARVVRQPGGFLVATRALTRSQVLKQAAPVRLFVSTDLRQWKPFPSPGDDWLASSHALLFDGELWLLGVRPRADSNDIEGELLRFQPDVSAWTVVSPAQLLPDWSSENVELLPRKGGQDRPAVLYRQSSGRMSPLVPR